MLTGMFIFYHLGFIFPMFGFLVMMFFIFVMMSFFRRRWRRTPMYFDRSMRNRSYFPYYDGWRCGPGMWFDRDFKDVSYSSETSLDILKKRYAKGKISREEFDRMKRDIL